MSNNAGYYKNIDGYCLVKKIGHGGMGQVWRAKDPSGVDVAFKLIHPSLCADDNILNRIRREVSILSKLDHHNIVPLLDYEFESDTPFIVTELVDGFTLDEYVKTFGRMDYGQALNFAKQLYDTLLYLRSIRVVHRDLKPSNIIISDRPVLIDFGIAQKYFDDRITHTGLVAGTLGYLAPEVFAGANPSFESDLWALTALVGFVLTGANPFGSGSWSVILGRVQNTDICYDDFDLPNSLLCVLRACLNADVSKRLSFDILLNILFDLYQGISDSDICAWLLDEYDFYVRSFLVEDIDSGGFASSVTGVLDSSDNLDTIDISDTSATSLLSDPNNTSQLTIMNSGDGVDEYTSSTCEMTTFVDSGALEQKADQCKDCDETNENTSFIVNDNPINDGNTAEFAQDVLQDSTKENCYQNDVKNTFVPANIIGEQSFKNALRNRFDDNANNPSSFEDICTGSGVNISLNARPNSADFAKSSVEEGIVLLGKPTFFSISTFYTTFSCVILSVIYTIILFADFGVNAYIYNLGAIGCIVALLFFISYIFNYRHTNKVYRFFANLLRSPFYLLKGLLNAILFGAIAYCCRVLVEFFYVGIFEYDLLSAGILFNASSQNIIFCFCCFLVASFTGGCFLAIRRIFYFLNMTFSQFLVSFSLILVIVGMIVLV